MYGHLRWSYRSLSVQWKSCTLLLMLPILYGRYQWPRGLKCRSAAAYLLGLWVRIPPGAWRSVCCKSCVLSCTGLCVGLITRPEESYRVWCVWVWSSSTMRMLCPTWGCCAMLKKIVMGTLNSGCRYHFPVRRSEKEWCKCLYSEYIQPPKNLFH
jgi:hypothetical protein